MGPKKCFDANFSMQTGHMLLMPSLSHLKVSPSSNVCKDSANETISDKCSKMDPVHDLISRTSQVQITAACLLQVP
jgi:hypothetical protein